MARVRAKDTGPEWVVRRLVFHAGYRYRLHVSSLPGKPDLVFFGRRKLIFVHGCFWHHHPGCVNARIPKSRVEFWTDKLRGNCLRDQRNLATLTQAGWSVLIIWECDLADIVKLEARIHNFLEAKGDAPIQAAGGTAPR
jgi:DNA mismatch endonuclease (patch repair protein)